MADGYRNASGVDFVSLFDPDVIGDGPTAAGYEKSDGSLLKYAALKYGTKGPDVGYRDSAGVDLSNYWAAAGTAQYALPINGQTFSAAVSGLQNKGATAQIGFTASTDGTYTVQKGTNNGSGMTYVTLATGTWNTSGLPASSCQALYTTSIGSNGETLKGSFVTNNAASWTAVSSPLGATDQVAVAATEGSKGNLGTLQIQFRNTSTGQVFSNSTIYFDVSADGST